MLGIEKHLKTKIIPFWKKLIDYEFGGFYGKVDYQLDVQVKADKSLIAISRHLYSFSLWYGYFRDEELLNYANHAYQFLISKFKDQADEGFYWMLDHKGNPSDVTKHIYGQSFAIYALSEYAMVTKNQQVLDEAIDLFNLIEDKAHTNTFEYHEEFTKQWTKKDNELLSEHGAHLPYTTNSLLHLLEAYTNLYKASKLNIVRERIIELLNGFVKHLYDPEKKLFHMYITDERKIFESGQSYGHDIETCWLIDLALEVTQYKNHEISEMTKTVAYHVYHRAMTGKGLLCEVINSRICEDKIWWIQAEAMVGFYNQFQKTKETKYLQATKDLYHFIMTYIVDPRENSEWLWGVDAELKPIKYRGIAESWKAPYHNGRALIELMKRGLS